MPRPPADTDTTKSIGLLGVGSDLKLDFNTRIEATAKRDQNLRCSPSQMLSTLSGCNSPFTLLPQFQFNLRSSGTIGERVHVDVDYDSQREFDASNNLSLYYQGRDGARLQRLELGNVNLTLPASAFITSGIPSGNYGVQAIGRVGPLRYQAVAAQQMGNVVQSRVFRVGESVTEPGQHTIEDYQIESRRFFFTVDPALFRGRYPNIDILDRAQMASLRTSLPDTLRPTRVLIYRLQFGTQPQNPAGPRLRIDGDPVRGRQTYDVLREGVDYYIDPSQLWFALVRPLNANNERLAIAYNVRINGRDTVWVTTGGTPDIQASTNDQVANLVFEPNLAPASPAFRREIRSVYRIAGEDLVRESTKLRVVMGSGDQERPLTGSAQTLLQMFGIAQATNGGEFDAQNRLWPRASDPAYNLAGGAGDIRPGSGANVAGAPSRIIRDNFLIFPSLRPFAARDSGLVLPGNASNDLLYSIPGEYLYSSQHPSSVYRLNVSFQTTGSQTVGMLDLRAGQIRAGSERVLVDGHPLSRDADYRIDYDLGQVTFLRPDTLFPRPRDVEVRYEENPLFGASSTTMAGMISELPFRNGGFTFTAIRQQQGTNFTRPQLGFQSATSLMAGVTGRAAWDAPFLSRLVSRLPGSVAGNGSPAAASRLSIQGELASSHPQFAAGRQGSAQAYVESFESEGGIGIALSDMAWSYSSLPAYGRTLRSRFGGSFFEPARAASMAWQTNALTQGDRLIRIGLEDIDPLARQVGAGFSSAETMLWLTLHPIDVGGIYDRGSRQFKWNVANGPSGRRFRSIRTVLNPAGIDLSRSEFLEFWTLVDTSIVARTKNPTLIFDFGDISENTLSFAPETAFVRRNANGGVDTVYSGKKLQGFDRLDSERDPVSRAFNAETNDTGLPGDVVDTLIVIDGALVKRATNVAICQGSTRSVQRLGDMQGNCTVHNSRLDDEDIDQDNMLNYPNALREQERVLRYVVDLSDPARYTRIGGTLTDTVIVNGAPSGRTRRWVLVRIPFRAASDTLNQVDPRRLKALRLTMVSGSGASDAEPTQLPIARLRVVGAPWLSRSSATIAGIGGSQGDAGFVIASTVGTNDSTAALGYTPPPGISNQSDIKTAGLQPGLVQVNERSLRILAGNMPMYHRAETYFRFPAGPQNFMAYRELRLWGRGRNRGWGQNGELQMFVKVGRDENNFYLYRTPVNEGATAAAWLPEVRVDFNRFLALREQIQNAYLAGNKQSMACTGIDSALVANSVILSSGSRRFAACDDGYMVFTLDPAVSAPNLAAVQEMSVGFVRVGGANGISTLLPTDTLELWVDDIRLDGPVNSTGYAGSLAMNLVAGEFVDIRTNIRNRDPNFRQLGEQPSFLNERTVDISTTVHLEKLFPGGAGVAVPLTVTKVSTASDPLFLSHTDIRGGGVSDLRSPRNSLTAYTVALRRATPVESGVFSAIVNNLSATSSYVVGDNQSEYQRASTRNLTFGVEYAVASDSARVLRLPGWLDAALGVLPDALESGPISTLRSSAFRWNPTQFRFTSGMIRGSDRRLAFLKPAGAADDNPAITNAATRYWRQSGVLEFHPTNNMTTRWEAQSIRDLRNYGDSSIVARVASNQRASRLGLNAGFERERTMDSRVFFTPDFSSWFHPRGELAAQYSMLRDPNVRSLVRLPGVVGVDSVLAARDSIVAASSFTLPRRVTATQLASTGATIDVARALAARTRDSTIARRLSGMLGPFDVSYTRSLLSVLDAAAAAPPMGFQLGLGGPASYRRVGEAPATTAGYTGVGSVSGTIILPFSGAFTSRYTRTNTRNWISRFDAEATQAQVDGDQTIFPDMNVRWSYRPASMRPLFNSFGASAGYVRTGATVSLPSLVSNDPAQLRRSSIESYPLSASIDWAMAGHLRTVAAYRLTLRTDSMPGSISRSRGNDVNVDASRVFRIPESWGFGRQDLRARLAVQQSHAETYVSNGQMSVVSRLQDNGRRSYNFSAETDLSPGMLFTVQASRILTFDTNLNRRLQQTVLSTVLQIQFFGGDIH